MVMALLVIVPRTRCPPDGPAPRARCFPGLDYQQEIGLRHTRRTKNQTDGADAADHIPLR